MRPRGWKELARRVVLAACVAFAGVLAGFLLWPEPAARAAREVPVRLGALPVTLTSDLTEHAQALAERYLAETIELRAGDAVIALPRGELGARIDAARLTSLLSQAGDARGALRRVHAQALGARPLQMPVPAALDETRAMTHVLRLKDQVDRAPVEPRIDPRAQTVRAGADGAELDVYATLEQLELALQRGERAAAAVLRRVAPARGARAYAGVDMRALLADFETRYSRSDTAYDRTHNLRMAASKIDGYVLGPGQVFDFNEVVGGRTQSNGFKPATVIADGELTSGLGGGTCQIASTLHAAVFFAGLPILTRFPHSRPSFYIKLGLDATVVYGSQNFRFSNDRGYPVVLGLEVRDGRVYASVHGPARDRVVTLIRRIDEITPFRETASSDPALPSGLRVLVQRGVPGFKITRFRVIEEVATGHAVRERTVDTYPPTTQLWRVGAGPEAPADFVRPANDGHPEYVADEYLRLTQRGHEVYELHREPGRTGSYGWTEREGMIER